MGTFRNWHRVGARKNDQNRMVGNSFICCVKKRQFNCGEARCTSSKTFARHVFFCPTYSAGSFGFEPSWEDQNTPWARQVPLLFAACRFFDVTIVDHYLHCNNLILLPCGTKINNSVLDFSLTCQVLICLKFSHIHCFETIWAWSCCMIMKSIFTEWTFANVQMVSFCAGARKRVPKTTAKSCMISWLSLLRFGACRKSEESDSQGGQSGKEEGWKMRRENREIKLNIVQPVVKTCQDSTRKSNESNAWAVRPTHMVWSCAIFWFQRRRSVTQEHVLCGRFFQFLLSSASIRVCVWQCWLYRHAWKQIYSTYFTSWKQYRTW